MTVGFVLAVGEASLLAGALGLIAEPITYRWNRLRLGAWHVNSLGRFIPARSR
jgi:hypothetical protein